MNKFVFIQMAPKKWSKNTFGWARAEVLGALVNAVFLVALCFSIIVESVKRYGSHYHDFYLLLNSMENFNVMIILYRFIHVEEIDEPEWILVVGTAGLIVNLLGLCLFRRKLKIKVNLYPGYHSKF